MMKDASGSFDSLQHLAVPLEKLEKKTAAFYLREVAVAKEVIHRPESSTKTERIRSW